MRLLLVGCACALALGFESQAAAAVESEDSRLRRERRSTSELTVSFYKLPTPRSGGSQEVRWPSRKKWKLGAQLTLSRQLTYTEVAEQLGAAIGSDHLHLRFTRHQPDKDMPEPWPLKYRGMDKAQQDEMLLDEMLRWHRV